MAFLRNISKATNTGLNANIKHYMYILLENWLPNSAELSPSENVCSITATVVCADSESPSLQALTHCLQKARKLISLPTLQNLISSMPNKLRAVIKNKQNTVSY